MGGSAETACAKALRLTVIKITLDVATLTAVWKVDQRKSERLVETRQVPWACGRDDGWARVVAVEMEIGGGIGKMGGKLSKTCGGGGRGGDGDEVGRRAVNCLTVGKHVESRLTGVSGQNSQGLAAWDSPSHLRRRELESVIH